MDDAQAKILAAILGLIQTGGAYAIWGIIAWWLMNLIRIAIVAFSVVYSLKLVLGSVTTWISCKHEDNKEKIGLISQKASDCLVASLEEFREETKKAMKFFLEDAEILLKKYRVDSDKTAIPTDKNG